MASAKLLDLTATTDYSLTGAESVYAVQSSADRRATLNQILSLPSMDPATRTERLATTKISYYAPGPTTGTTAEYRQSLGFYINAGDGSGNAVESHGWNNADTGGTAINTAWGACRAGQEHCFYQSGSRASEIHPAEFLAPGASVARRAFSSQMLWGTGYFGPAIIGTGGNIRYQPLVGSAVDLIAWDGSSSANLAGNGMYVGTNDNRHFQQINVAGNAFISLPYVSTSDEIVRGYDPNTTFIPIGRERGIRFLPTTSANIPTPASGVTLFFNSATSLLSTKDSAGTVAAV